jgi:hypothetical protein
MEPQETWCDDTDVDATLRFSFLIRRKAGTAPPGPPFSRITGFAFECRRLHRRSLLLIKNSNAACFRSSRPSVSLAGGSARAGVVYARL